MLRYAEVRRLGKERHDTQHNDTQYNNTLDCLAVSHLWLMSLMLSAFYAECRKKHIVLCVVMLNVVELSVAAL